MRFSVLIILTFFSYLNLFAQNNWENVTVIGNSVGFDKIDKANIKKVFLGNVNNWPNDNNTIVVLPSTKYSSADDLTKLIIGKSHNITRRYWLSIVFQGRANPPIYMDNNQKIIEYVNQTKGSIAVLINYRGEKLKNEIIVN